MGIITLNEAVPTTGDHSVNVYANLPTAGFVDLLPNKAAVDLVGYGVQVQVTGGGLPPRLRWTGPRVRLLAPSEFVSGKFTPSENFMKIALNASKGAGGTCFGDSGGPILDDGTATVLAVNSRVTNNNCSGVG
ncbi:MAG TPA: hypothetical protein VIV15_10700, partial [Anaerolineales bacterium]